MADTSELVSYNEYLRDTGKTERPSPYSQGLRPDPNNIPIFSPAQVGRYFKDTGMIHERWEIILPDDPKLEILK